jgi:ribosomal protein S18 acetylase RimI-like enzyme
MSVISTLIGRLLTVRAMEPADLPRLLALEMQRLGSRRIQKDSPIRLPSDDQGIWVAAIQNALVGYLIYQILPEESDSLKPTSPAKKALLSVQTPRIVLQHVYVANDWHRRGIGRALVERFEPDVSRHEGMWIEAAVPESNLPMQVLLRSLGYKAVRVLRSYYGDEDAYLMEVRRD